MFQISEIYSHSGYYRYTFSPTRANAEKYLLTEGYEKKDDDTWSHKSKRGFCAIIADQSDADWVRPIGISREFDNIFGRR